MIVRRIVDCSIEEPLEALSNRGIARDQRIAATVSQIIEDVRARGDEALLENAQQFDSPSVESLFVFEEEIEAAQVSPEHDEAIRTSVENVMRFHEAQLYYFTEQMEALENRLPKQDARTRFLDVPESEYRWREETEHGGYLGQRLLPVESAGVYVPGGKASYPSSVIMNVCPANVAMVREVFMTTPVGAGGFLSPAVLVAARYCHVTEIFKIGGAAAIAALALGTQSVPKVDKIVGPGNKYVNEAKRQLWGSSGFDGYAGPSEVCVLADNEANASWAAADLLTQVEHSEDNIGFLITLSRRKAEEILQEADKQMTCAPRENILRKALLDEGMVFVAEDIVQAYEIANAIAPEHLSLAVRDPEAALDNIRNAGCVLLGDMSPESAGDFAAGPSHTLPTSGAARFGSPVNVLDFLKIQSLIRMTRADVEAVAPTVQAFGEMEGFPAHARGVQIRLGD